MTQYLTRMISGSMANYISMSTYRQSRYAILTGVQSVFQIYKLPAASVSYMMEIDRRDTYEAIFPWECNNPIPNNNSVYERTMGVRKTRLSF